MFQIVKFKDAYTPICMYVCTHAYININAWSKEKHLRVWNPPIIGPLFLKFVKHTSVSCTGPCSEHECLISSSCYQQLLQIAE